MIRRKACTSRELASAFRRNRPYVSRNIEIISHQGGSSSRYAPACCLAERRKTGNCRTGQGLDLGKILAMVTSCRTPRDTAFMLMANPTTQRLGYASEPSLDKKRNGKPQKPLSSEAAPLDQGHGNRQPQNNLDSNPHSDPAEDRKNHWTTANANFLDFAPYVLLRRIS